MTMTWEDTKQTNKTQGFPLNGEIKHSPKTNQSNKQKNKTKNPILQQRGRTDQNAHAIESASRDKLDCVWNSTSSPDELQRIQFRAKQEATGFTQEPVCLREELNFLDTV